MPRNIGLRKKRIPVPLSATGMHNELKKAGVIASEFTPSEPVLENKRGGEKGPRLLMPTTFDEASYTVSVPMITAANLRMYIERQARPLEKLIRIANGQTVNGIQPAWDDQKEAIYKLVDKVAPDLKAVEVTHDVDPESTQGSSGTVNKLVNALTELALAKRAGEAVTITQGDVPSKD